MSDFPSNPPVPELSVIMATYNRRRLLPRTLESIFAQDLPPHAFELIVVDDGSTDETKPYVQSLQPQFSLRVLDQENRGQSAAFNHGIAAARGRILLLLDDDLLLDPGNFRAHLEAHAKADRLVVHGPVLVSPESARNAAADWIQQCVDDEIARWQWGWTWPDDANIDPNYSVARTAVLAAGGYDESMRWRHSTELGIRLAKMGLKWVYEPRAACQHIYTKTPGQLLGGQVRAWGREELAVLHKHPDLRPYSPLARTGQPSLSGRLAIGLIARWPGIADAFLQPFSLLCHLLRGIPALRRLGLRLLWKRVFISLLRGAVETVGWPAVRASFANRLPVLMYHHVGPPQANFDRDLTVSTSQFEKQIRYLAGLGYTGIRAADWLAWIDEGKPLPEKPMLLTFDDAFQDLKDHAFPILERHGFGGVVFVVTHQVGKDNRWDEARGYDLLPCLTAAEIRSSAARGIEFGAHSRTHADFTRLNDAQLDDELGGSREDLAALLGEPVTTFAYPFGHYNQAAAACARRSIPLAFTTDDGLNTLATDRALLHRNMVYAWDRPIDLASLVWLGWNPLRTCILAARRRLRFLKVWWRKAFPARTPAPVAR